MVRSAWTRRRARCRHRPAVDRRSGHREHLLACRSGIGDYLDEDALGDNNHYVLSVPVHELATTEQFLAVFDGHPTKFEPGERFNYCNGRLRGAGVARRAGIEVFRRTSGSTSAVPAGRNDRPCVPAIRRAAGPAAPVTLDDEGLRTTCSTCQCGATGTAGVYRRRRTSTPCGTPCSPGGSRPAGDGCADGAPTQRRGGGVDALTGSASGSTTRQARCRCTASMPAPVRHRRRSRSTTHLHGVVQPDPWGMAGQSTPRPTARHRANRAMARRLLRCPGSLTGGEG